MEVPVYIFEPITFKATLITVIFAFLSISILGFLIYLNKKEMSYDEAKRRGLFSILLGIAFLLTTSTAVLNFWNSQKFKTIKLYKDSIETPRGKIAFEDIQNAYIYIDKPMKGHNLMQAIARVNRVYKDKPGGLIVDYLRNKTA